MASLGHFKIETPYWKYMSVGIAEEKICDVNHIEIMYEDKFGNRKFPHVYMATREELMACPVSVVKNNTRLRQLPIEKLHVIG